MRGAWKACFVFALGIAICGSAAANDWIPLCDKPIAEVWKKPTGKWFFTNKVVVDPKDPQKLAANPSEGRILVNGPGKTNNLVSKERFGDVEIHVDFMIPKGSNAGIKFEGQYEIQIFDS